MNRSERWMDAVRRCHNRENELKMKAATLELREFIESPAGQIACHHLLRVSNKSVIFGKSEQLHPADKVKVFALVGGANGGLLMLVDEFVGGFSIARVVKITSISAETMVEAAVKYSHMEPENILPWLLGQLDEIALSIP